MTLSDKRCLPCEKGGPSLPEKIAMELMSQIPGWELAPGSKEISRLFTLDSYWAALGFVNAVAWIAQSEKHHPDIDFGCKKVKVKLCTHAVGGLSENDFIVAAKVNALVA